ncbi:PD-(D/E)XK nuclease superfamily protein, partial [Desulfobotulus alkaliphilus]
SLYNHINARIERFITYYNFMGFSLPEIKINPDDAIYTMERLISAVEVSGYALYLLIDEYDNFANTILMSSADKKEDYDKLVKEEGVLRTVFKAVKALTSGTMIDKVFITGVSPVVLSDITSGYNVAKSVYHKPLLNDLCGFSEKEIRAEIENIVKNRNSKDLISEGEAAIEDAVNTMRSFYNGYLFSIEADEFIYNPTMCIYFFEEFAGNGKYPKEMLDSNLSTDQAKLSYIASLNGGQALIINLMEKEDSVVIKSVQRSFGIEEILFDSSRDRQFLTSFLYYFGILTIAEETPDLETRLKIPNMAVKGLYADKLCNLLLPDSEERDAGRLAAKKVFQKGDMQPLCDFVEKKYFKVFSNRDYILANELTLKTAFLTLLYNDIIFLMDSESEISRRYSDLTMIIRPDKRYGRVYDVLIEFKFVSLKEAGLSGKEALALSVDELKSLPSIGEKMKEGTEQVTDYGARLEEKYKNVRLQKFVVTALGFDRVCFEKIGEAPPLPE